MGRASHDVHFEILKSEQLRATALTCLFATLLVLSLAVFAFVPRGAPGVVALFGDRFPFGRISLFWGVAFGYELAARAVLGAAIRRGIHPPEVARYVNAAIETSFPTALMVLLTPTVGPERALNSPVPMLYFLFIALSTLRLGVPLSLFTGCVAAFEFSALGVHYLRDGGEMPAFFESTWPIYMKSVVMVAAGVVAGFVGGEIRRRLVASLELIREKNRVIGMFGQYVAPAVVDRLLSQPVDSKGEVRHVTIMFLDIRDFTTFAERRTPEDVVDYLNTLFGTMITIVNRHHGIINKFLGDGFLACFGAPLSDGRDTQNAVGAALDIVTAVEAMNAAGTIAPTRIGIGLHAGPVVTGSVGSEERKEYTLIGDTVNLASRVEQLTKQYGAAVLMTDAVWQIVKDEYPARPLDAVLVKGRAAPVSIYSLP
jgi:adenylate cyclase